VIRPGRRCGKPARGPGHKGLAIPAGRSRARSRTPIQAPTTPCPRHVPAPRHPRPSRAPRPPHRPSRLPRSSLGHRAGMDGAVARWPAMAIIQRATRSIRRPWRTGSPRPGSGHEKPRKQPVPGRGTTEGDWSEDALPTLLRPPRRVLPRVVPTRAAVPRRRQG